jgi:antitoxin Phd
MRWQLQDVKQRFSELVQHVLDEGPQTVTRRGKEAVVVIAADEYRRLTGSDGTSSSSCLRLQT